MKTNTKSLILIIALAGLTACIQAPNRQQAVALPKADTTTTTTTTTEPGSFAIAEDGKRAKAVQCAGTTKTGDRCKKQTRTLSGYCWMHEDQATK